MPCSGAKYGRMPVKNPIKLRGFLIGFLHDSDSDFGLSPPNVRRDEELLQENAGVVKAALGAVLFQHGGWSYERFGFL